MTDRDYMCLALKLAKKGCRLVDPNPMVGAVIVKNGKIIGTGYHKVYGELHAERLALLSCTEPAEGATIYVTLEPCCHWGKTPPCTDALIKHKIRRVVIGSCDPNPFVSGKGIKKLREYGIDVTEGILKKECDKLNEVFFHYIRTKTPYVIMKYAMTLDGKIATSSGKSKWITGESARQQVQNARNRYSAVMVGVGTVLIDDPLLTCRIPNGRNPIRIICDTHLRTPLSSHIVSTAAKVRTIFATCSNEEAKLTLFREAGCEVCIVPAKNGHVDLNALMKRLGESGIDSILLEGGAALNWSALESGIVNKVQAYIAPKLFGGDLAKSPVGGCGIDLPCKAFTLSAPEIIRIGDDLLLESEVKPCSQVL